ncbi:hypothetical protein [Methylobacterium fujisawaense]
MADQLSVTNAALGHLGSRPIASLDEPREAPRVCALEWEAAVRWCLEMTGWQFATRSAAIPANGAAPPNQYASTLPKPADWIKTVDISVDGRLSIALEDYVEEGPYWYADPAVIFVRFVSSDPAYGFNVDRWPTTFADLVALRLAERAARRIANAADLLGEIQKRRTEAAQEALTVEEQNAARTFVGATEAGEVRLSIYNSALAHLGRARAVSLTQTTDTVRELNDQWRTSVRWCLQRAPWSFASRTLGFTPTDTVTPRAGFAHAFVKPADWVLTANIAQDGELQTPVDAYVEDQNVWFADCPALYVRMVSSDPQFGFNVARWSPQFCDLVALRLAEVSCGRLAQDAKDLWSNLVKLRGEAEMTARAIENESVARVVPVGGNALTRLQIYNDALAHMGLPRVPSLTDVGDVVRELNDQFRTCLRWTLQQAWWSFALRAKTFTPIAGSVPPNGFANVIQKPADWISSVEIAADARFTFPVTAYVDEFRYWFTDAAALSVRYVSDDPLFGADPSTWPPYFADLLALRIAEKSCGRLGGDPVKLKGIVEMRAAAEAEARRFEAEVRARTMPPSDPTAAIRLRIYNEALGHLGQPRAASLAEVGVATRALNEAWEAEVLWCLQQGPWTFATRSLTLAAVDGVVPLYGFEHAYQKPEDYLRTVALMVSGDWREPLMHYTDGDGVWYTNTVGLAVRYVSSHEDWGFNLPNWSPTFAALVALRLAEKCALRITSSANLVAGLIALRERALKDQRAKDAINTEVAFAPSGTWTRARRGSGWGTRGGGFPDGGTLQRRPNLGLAGTQRQLAGSVTDYAGYGAELPPEDGAGLAGADPQRAGDPTTQAGAEPPQPTDDLSTIRLADQDQE